MKYFCLCLLMILGQWASTQDMWLNYTNNYFVTDVLETEDGLWLASTGGLVHYDSNSNNVSYYNRGNSEILSNQINHLLHHPNGDIWMTTSLGICKWRDNQFVLGPEKMRGKLAILPNNKVVVANFDSLYIQTDDMLFDAIPYPGYVADIGGIEIDSSGAIYFNAINFFAETYIAVLKNNQWDTLFSDFIYESAISLDHNNQLWFLSAMGLKMYENNEWVDIIIPDSLNAFSIGGLSVDIDNNIILQIGHDCPEMMKWDGNSLTTIPYVKNDCQDVHFIQPSEKMSNVYFATNKRHGFYQFSSNEIGDYQAYTQSPIPYNSLVNTRHKGDLSHFMVYYDKIQILKNGIWTHFPIPSNIVGNIRLAELDHNDILWICDDQQLWSYGNDQWNPLQIPSQITDMISLMTTGENGDLWIQSGLNIARYKDGQWKNFTTSQHDITTSIIKDMKVDPQNGDLWVSSFQGVRHYNGQSWTRYDLHPVNHAFALAIGDPGVFVHTGSLFLIRNGQIDTLAKPTEGYYGPFEADMVYHNNSEKLYLTGTNVLAVFHNDQWTVHSTKNSGIYNNSTNDISIDPNGNIWLAGRGGGIGVFNTEGVVLSTKSTYPTREELKIIVFPNLIEGDLTYVSSPEAGEYKVNITDASGKILKSQHIYLSANLPISLELPQVFNQSLYLVFQRGNRMTSKMVIRLR